MPFVEDTYRQNIQFLHSSAEAKDKIAQSESDRLRLEIELNRLSNSNEANLKSKATKLKAYYTRLCEAEAASERRNQQLLGDMQHVDAQFQQLEAKLEQLNSLKNECENYLRAAYPAWTAQSHVLEPAASLVNGGFNYNATSPAREASQNEYGLKTLLDVFKLNTKQVYDEYSSAKQQQQQQQPATSSAGAAVSSAVGAGNSRSATDQPRASGGDAAVSAPTAANKSLSGLIFGVHATPTPQQPALTSASTASPAAGGGIGDADLLNTTSHLFANNNNSKNNNNNNNSNPTGTLQQPNDLLKEYERELKRQDQTNNNNSNLLNMSMSLSNTAQQNLVASGNQRQQLLLNTTFDVEAAQSERIDNKSPERNKQALLLQQQQQQQEGPLEDGGMLLDKISLWSGTKADAGGTGKSTGTATAPTVRTRSPQALQHSPSSSLPPNDEESSLRQEQLNVTGIIYLLDAIEQDLTSTIQPARYYRQYTSPPPHYKNKLEIIRLAQQQQQRLVDLDASDLTMVVLDQLPGVVRRHTAQQCVLTARVLALSVADVDENVVADSLAASSADDVRLWRRLMQHWRCLRRTSPMSVAETAALFASSLVGSGGGASVAKATEILYKIIGNLSAGAVDVTDSLAETQPLGASTSINQELLIASTSQLKESSAYQDFIQMSSGGGGGGGGVSGTAAAAAAAARLSKSVRDHDNHNDNDNDNDNDDDDDEIDALVAPKSYLFSTNSSHSGATANAAAVGNSARAGASGPPQVGFMNSAKIRSPRAAGEYEFDFSQSSMTDSQRRTNPNSLKPLNSVRSSNDKKLPVHLRNLDSSDDDSSNDNSETLTARKVATATSKTAAAASGDLSSGRRHNSSNGQTKQENDDVDFDFYN